MSSIIMFLSKLIRLSKAESQAVQSPARLHIGMVYADYVYQDAVQAWRDFLAKDDGPAALFTWLAQQQGKTGNFIELLNRWSEDDADLLTPFDKAVIAQVKAFANGQYLSTNNARDGCQLQPAERIRLSEAWEKAAGSVVDKGKGKEVERRA